MKNAIVFVFIVLSVRCAIAQSAPPVSWKCDPREYAARFRAGDPAYSEAMQLSQILRSGGIQVKCVLRSKFEHFFAGQKGAALYRTDHGDFEALFAVRPEDFANLSVVGRPQQGGAYVYELYGTPEVRELQSSRREYFVKHGATFIITWENQQLAASLKAILASH